MFGLAKTAMQYLFPFLLRNAGLIKHIALIPVPGSDSLTGKEGELINRWSK